MKILTIGYLLLCCRHILFLPLQDSYHQSGDLFSHRIFLRPQNLNKCFWHGHGGHNRLGSGGKRVSTFPSCLPDAISASMISMKLRLFSSSFLISLITGSFKNAKPCTLPYNAQIKACRVVCQRKVWGMRYEDACIGVRRFGTVRRLIATHDSRLTIHDSRPHRLSNLFCRIFSNTSSRDDRLTGSL